MHIRQATLSDAPVVTEFNIRLAEESEQLRLDADCVSAGVAAVLADAAKGVYFVADADGAVVGQLMITYEWSDWRNGNIWWIQSVYVREDFRGRGVFRALFMHVRESAGMRRDVRCVRLYVHGENVRAKRSYKKLGMKRTKYEVFELDLEQASHEKK